MYTNTGVLLGPGRGGQPGVWLLGPEESGLSTTELVKILDFFFLII